MYERFMNNQVSVFVTPKTSTFMEYKGTLVDENEETIVLNNVVIEFAATAAAKSFISGASLYKSNIDTVVINKEFIISCNSL